MLTQTLDAHIEITPGTLGGKPRIVGHRISVQDVAIWHEWMGRSADEIAADHGLTLADVYAALAYYDDHRQEIDAMIKESEAFVNAFQDSIPSKIPQKRLPRHCRICLKNEIHEPIQRKHLSPTNHRRLSAR